MTSPSERTGEPVDSDVDLSQPDQRRERDRVDRTVVAAVALGGGLGSAARYGASLALPTAPGAFPVTTLLVNVAGCAMIGVLIAALAERRSAHRLIRPFLGTGVLGGFTTFSAHVLDAHTLIGAGHAGTALMYLLATLAAALAAVWGAATATRRLLARRRR